MALPKGWSATDSREFVTITSNVGGTPAQHSTTVSCTKKPGKQYPRLDRMDWYEGVGTNLACDFHRGGNEESRGVTVRQESTSEDVEGQHNVAHVYFYGRDSDNKRDQWRVSVHSDVCP